MRKRLASPHLRRLRVAHPHPPASRFAGKAPLLDDDVNAKTPSAAASAPLMDHFETPAGAFRITRATYLECDDASDSELVVAVEFDLVDLVRLPCQASTSGVGGISGVPINLTLAGDGGPVRQATVTIFTLTVSTPLLPNGRSPLLSVL